MVIKFFIIIQGQMKRYDAIDGLRSISMIGILIMHVLANINYRDNLSELYFYIKNLSRLTSLFMMVSAFSISCGYYEKIQNSWGNVEEYYKNRYKKIIPFFAFLTIADIFINHSKGCIYEGLANVTLAFGLIPHESITVIGVGWTLGVIFVFYLLFPFFVFLMRNKYRFILAYCASIFFSLIANNYFGLGKVDFLYCSCYFFTGCFLYLHKKTIEQYTNKVIMIISVVILMALFLRLELYRNVIQLILFTLLLIYAIKASSGKSILSTSPMRFLSSISLEIYLCHMVIYRIAEKIGLIHVVNNDLISYIILCLFVMVGSIILSITFKRIIGLLYSAFKNEARIEV